jgi:DNA-binding NarL/FixJ family response regulator
MTIIHHKGLTITKREKEVLQGIWNGLTSIEIGKRMGITPKTVAAHRQHLMMRLGVNNAAQLLRAAMTHGMVTL